MFIRTVAAEVKGHNDKYEETLREREKGNARYAFLTNHQVGQVGIPAACKADT